MPSSRSPELLKIIEAVHQRQRFVLSSHSRPDGDSIGSQLAMAYALELLGKDVRIVNADPAPEHYMEFPGVARIELLRAAGTSKSNLLSTTIYLASISTFNEMNAVWDAWVDPFNTPARATVEAKLAAPQYLVEIMVTAAV